LAEITLKVALPLGLAPLQLHLLPTFLDNERYIPSFSEKKNRKKTKRLIALEINKK